MCSSDLFFAGDSGQHLDRIENIRFATRIAPSQDRQTPERDRRSAKGPETQEPDFRQSRYHHADNLPQYPSPSRLRTIPLAEHVKINCDLFRLLAQKCGPLDATFFNSFQLLRVDAVAANIQRRHPTHGLQLLGEHTRLEARAH